MRALVRRLLRDEDGLARQMVAAAGTAMSEVAVAELDDAHGLALARASLRLFLETIETGELPTSEAFAPLAESAARWAADGGELPELLAAYAAGTRVGWDALRAAATEVETDDLVTAGRLVLVCTDAIAQVVAEAFLEERLHVAAAAQSAEWALVDAVLAGRPTADAAARAGRKLDDAYGVLLLSGAVARVHLRSFEGAIAGLGGGRALWRLSAIGANVLVPVPAAEAEAWTAGADELLAGLARAAGDAPLVAAAAWGAGSDGVARAGDDAVTVLRLVTGMGRPPGLYRLDDVLLEAALSGAAPGPAARLAALLVPLEETGGTELLATLDTYVAHDADRRRAAAALHVHPNTLDYRLRRIAEVTGYSPATARGLQVLGAALTLRRVGRIRAVGR